MENYETTKGLEIEEALERMKNELAPLRDTKNIPIEDAWGRIVASDITAGFSRPSFPRSAMDGYAVNPKDVMDAKPEHPVRLNVLGEIFAGERKEIPYQTGSAIRVMTGAMIPKGYHAVVRQEDTDLGEHVVSINRPVAEYQNYCKVGEDLHKGDLVVPSHRRLGRIEIGLFAGLGMDRVEIVRPAKIAILSTGSELLRPGEPLEPGKIYNSISYMLKAAIQRERLEVVVSDLCEDTGETLCETLKRLAGQADFILTTGGVSVGKKDLVPDALKMAGAKTVFYRAKIQPGTPTLGSVLDGTGILSLSGNPYAALANFDYYFWPLAGKLMGSDAFDLETSNAVLAEDYHKVNKMRRLVRARVQNGVVSFPDGGNASSVISNLTECNCYVDLEAGRQALAGDQVRILKMKA